MKRTLDSSSLLYLQSLKPTKTEEGACARIDKLMAMYWHVKKTFPEPDSLYWRDKIITKVDREAANLIRIRRYKYGR